MDSTVFLKAAERVDAGARCCCWALWGVENERAPLSRQHRDWFERTFEPTAKERRGRNCWSAFWFDIGCADTEARERRVIALCLAAAMAKGIHEERNSNG